MTEKEKKDSGVYSTDPICGMQVKADSPYVLEDCHRLIVFCSKHCQERFERLAPDVDPVCGMHVPANSPYTLNSDGHLLRFCSVDCRAVFQRKIRNNCIRISDSIDGF